MKEDGDFYIIYFTVSTINADDTTIGLKWNGNHTCDVISVHEDGTLPFAAMVIYSSL